MYACVRGRGAQQGERCKDGRKGGERGEEGPRSSASGSVYVGGGGGRGEGGEERAVTAQKQGLSVGCGGGGVVERGEASMVVG